MTAQSFDTETEPPRQRQLSLTERHFTSLDAFLRDGPGVWGGPTGLGGEGVREDGFAALRFDATPISVTRTRRFLRSTLTNWQLADLVDDATTIAAELVANAVTHALQPPVSHRSPYTAAWITLLRMDRAVVCAVSDPSPALPAPSDPDPFAESGRGLHIVAELSESWGHSPAASAGKTVWARLASGR